MPIKDIANLNLYVRTEGGAIEGRMIDLVPYPMVVRKRPLSTPYRN
ncbi:hypothetical protein [Methylophaga nitratireducenticrescens]|nr:hypothetical protein [Methylophaga nitratireducenticrescens]